MAFTLPQADYRIDVYNTAGVSQGRYTNFLPLSYTRKVNAPGLLQFALSDTHRIAENIEDKWQVEVWRKPYGGDWSRELTGIWRVENWSYAETAILELTCPGLMSILGWREIAYYANTANRTKFTTRKAETIANTLVKYNATTSGTTGDGRMRAAAGGYPFTGLTVEADGATGNTFTGGFYCAWKNLLETLQDIAVVGGGDFDIVKTSSTAWQWRWYVGQLGTDRTTGSGRVVFSMANGNMANPHYEVNRIDVKTVAIVAGQGEENDRDVSVVESDDYAAGNDIELFVGATDIDKDDTDGLTSRGEEKLAEAREKPSFTFDVLQTGSAQYGVNYTLGDKVIAINPRSGAEITMKIIGVTVGLDADGKESIEIDVEEMA